MSPPQASTYKTWTALDFAEDALFLAWVKYPDGELDRYWQGVLEVVPEIRDEVLLARQIVLAVSRAQTEEEERVIRDIHLDIEARLGFGDYAYPQPTEAPVIAIDRAPRNRSWMATGLRYAAALVGIGVGVGLWLFQRHSGTAPQSTVATVANTYARVTLPDGSQVVLNHNAQLRYTPGWKEGQAREVWLEGEGYFEVAKRRFANEPVKFIVHAGELDAVVKGTHFVVNTHEDRTEVLLEEGRVDIATPEGRTLCTMQPSDLIVKRRGDARIRRSQVWPAIYTGWAGTRAELHNTSLAEIAAMIEHGFGKKVLFGNPSMAQKRFGGTISTTDYRLMLAAIGKITSTHVSETGDTIRLE